IIFFRDGPAFLAGVRHIGWKYRKNNSNCQRICPTTVGEPSRKFSQVALPDWLTAQRTERLRGASCHSPRRISYVVSAFRFLLLHSCREQERKKTPDEEPAKKVHWGASSLARSATSIA